MIRFVLILLLLTSCVQNRWSINENTKIQIYLDHQTHWQIMDFELYLDIANTKMNKTYEGFDFKKELFIENLLKNQIGNICDIQSKDRPKIKHVFLKDIKPTLPIAKGWFICDPDEIRLILNKRIKEKLIHSGFLAYIQLGKLYTNGVGENPPKLEEDENDQIR